MKAIVYRFFDARGKLLYVGLTVVGPARWTAHAISQPWWPLVERVQVAHYPSVEDASLAEARAIEIENPVHNVTHKHRDGVRLPRARRRSPGTGSVYQDGAGRWVAQRSVGPRGGRTVQRRYRHSKSEAERALFEMVYR